jgi:hypothetical protein
MLENIYLTLLKKVIMIEKKLVRFPNESEFIEMEINMDEFDNDKTFEQEMFGWYKGIYISIKL